MYSYKNGTSHTADWQAAIYGLGADNEWSYLIVSDSIYSELSSSFFEAYSDLSEAISLYQKELLEVASTIVISGEMHDSLVEYAEIFNLLSQKMLDIGNSYKSLCLQFISAVEAADEDMYEKGCDPRDYSNDRIGYFVSLIEDAKGHFGSWLDNLINNVFEGLKHAFFSLTQKNKYNITSPDAKFTKEYRQSLLDKLNYDKEDIKNIQKEVKLIDDQFEKKYGELYDSIIEIQSVIENANSIVQNGLCHSDIVSLHSRVNGIVINMNEEIIKERISVDEAGEYCSNDANRDVFAKYSDELDSARKGLGIEEAIYAGIATGISQAKMEILGEDLPDKIAPSERYSYLLMKKQLSETIANMAGNPVDISEYEKEEIYNWLYKALNGDESEIPEEYKEVFDKLIKYLRDKSKVADYVTEGIMEAILPIFYDYSANLEIIKSLSNGVDPNSMLGIAVEDLIGEYTDMVSTGITNVVGYIEEKISEGAVGALEKTLESVLGACIEDFNLYSRMAKKAMQYSGVIDAGNSSMRLFSLYESNEQLINAYRANFDVVASGNYNEIDVEKLNNSFEILKSTFKEEFKLAAEIAGTEGKHDDKRHYKAMYKEIDGMSMQDFI